jgi:hypothetical protein
VCWCLPARPTNANSPLASIIAVGSRVAYSRTASPAHHVTLTSAANAPCPALSQLTLYVPCSARILVV